MKESQCIEEYPPIISHGDKKREKLLAKLLIVSILLIILKAGTNSGLEHVTAVRSEKKKSRGWSTVCFFPPQLSDYAKTRTANKDMMALENTRCV